MNNERIEHFKQEINKAIVAVTTNKKKYTQDEHKYLKSFGYNLIFEGGLDGYIVENPETGKRAYCKHMKFNMSHPQRCIGHNYTVYPRAYYTKDKIDFVSYLNTPRKKPSATENEYKRAFESYQWRLEKVQKATKQLNGIEKELAEEIERLVKRYADRREYYKQELAFAQENMEHAKEKLNDFKTQAKEG